MIIIKLIKYKKSENHLRDEYIERNEIQQQKQEKTK